MRTTVSSIPALRWMRHGFTLVEMLVSVAVLGIVMVLATEMIDDTEKIWKTTNAKVDAFQGARAGFQLMTDQLRQATLNTYYDYYDAAGMAYGPWLANSGNATGAWTASGTGTTFVPATYGRQSELHFISGALPSSKILPPGGSVFTQSVFFQFPQDYTANETNYGTLNRLLNGSGFFIEFSPETASFANSPPSFYTGLSSYVPKYRFRLIQFVQPTENFSVYNYSITSGTSPFAWFVNAVNTVPTAPAAPNVRIVADNIIALIIWPKMTDSPTDSLTSASTTGNLYDYDSRMGASSGSPPWVPGTSAAPNAQPLAMNQMPPILRVAMVAIDEPSAQRIQAANVTPPPVITNAIGATANQSRFTDPVTASATAPPDQMDLDLASLGTDLVAAKINYRIFDTTLAVRSAKFSSQ